MEPDRVISKELKRLDENLGLQWNRKRCRWETYYRRRFLRPSERRRFEPICMFYRGGFKINICEAKPIDRFHICFWQGPQGQFRPLSSGLIDHLRSLDTWTGIRPKDIWLGIEANEEREEELRQRRTRGKFEDIIRDNDGQFRRELSNLRYGNRTHWARHYPANWRIGDPFKVKPAKVK